MNYKALVIATLWVFASAITEDLFRTYLDYTGAGRILLGIVLLWALVDLYDERGERRS